MSATIVTSGLSEADIESRIDAALRKIFYWLPADALRHQTKLRLQLGHTVIDIDGAALDKIEGRMDVFVSLRDQPLCVIELKRPGLALEPKDTAQGLSYARVLHPRPPLVVISNGDDTKIVATHTGLDWTPQTPSEAELKTLIAAAADVSAKDLKQALDVLLAPDKAVWSSALRAATKSVLAEQTGGWADEELPYAADFLVPREATDLALSWLDTNGRILIVDGAPLSGKSNIVRDLALRLQDDADRVVLVVEADAVATHGVIRTLTNIFANALGWPVTADEARDWLRKLSRGSGPSLLLVLDGVTANSDALRGDIEELSDDSYGPKLRLVLVMDDTTVDSFIRKASGRNPSPIGRRAKAVTVGPLTDEEFDRAQAALHDKRIGFIPGAQYSAEYRTPWLLRSLGAAVTILPRYADQAVSAALPPMLSLDLIRSARRRFDGDDDLRRQFGQIARATLADRDSGKPSTFLVLEAMSTFLVRRQVFFRHLSAEDFKVLHARGLVRPWRTPTREDVIVPRLPELLAAELAACLAEDLQTEIDKHGPAQAANWLVTMTARLPMGDVIGAQTILDAAEASGTTPLGLVTQLLSARPHAETVKPGTRAAAHIPGAGVLDITFGENGALTLRHGGHVEVLEGDGTPNTFYADFESWLILSHFAGIPAEVRSESGALAGRLDPMLLSEVGSSPIVLRRPGNNPDMNSFLAHDIPGHGTIACYDRGIIEPITFSILEFLSREGERTEDWIDEAVERGSIPLLSRIDIALRELGRTANPAAPWARAIRKARVAPALAKIPDLLH